jgi:hypothetical protein
MDRPRPSAPGFRHHPLTFPRQGASAGSYLRFQVQRIAIVSGELAVLPLWVVHRRLSRLRSPGLFPQAMSLERESVYCTCSKASSPWTPWWAHQGCYYSAGGERWYAVLRGARRAGQLDSREVKTTNQDAPWRTAPPCQPHHTSHTSVAKGRQIFTAKRTFLIPMTCFY